MYNVKVYFRSGNQVDMVLTCNLVDEFEKKSKEMNYSKRTYSFMRDGMADGEMSWGVIDFSQVEMIVAKEIIGEKKLE